MKQSVFQERVSVPKGEYVRLKRLDKQFGALLEYLGYLSEIREARGEVKKGKMVAQERLFKRLGF